MHTATYSNSSLRNLIDPVVKYDEALLAQFGDASARDRSVTGWRDAAVMLIVGTFLFLGGIALSGWTQPGQLSADAIEHVLAQ